MPFMTLTNNSNTTLVSAIALSSALLVGCGGGSSESDIGTPSSTRANSTVQGSAIKGAISDGLVRAYPIEVIGGVATKSSTALPAVARTGVDGSYTLDLGGDYSGETLVIEIAADAATRMACDVTEGCGTDGSGNPVSFGDLFSLSSDFVISGIAQVAENQTSVQVPISPLTHMAVARATSATGGLTTSNIASAKAYIEATFDLDLGALDLDAADITRLDSVAGFTKSQIEHGIVSAALLALVNAPDWDGIEEVIEDVTQRLASGGQIASVNMGSLREVTLDDVFFQANEIADDVVLMNSGSDYSASLATIATETQSSYDDAASAPEAVDPVVIVSNPQAVTVEEGSQAQFSVAAQGGGSLSFQWRYNGQALPGENASTLTIASAALSDIGTYDVVVSNSVGSTASLAALLQVTEQVQPDPTLASIDLSWDIPTLREDGSSLELYEINGYVINYGTVSGQLNSVVNIVGAGETTATIADLPSGTYYFAIATIDSDGVQGNFSSEIQQTIL